MVSSIEDAVADQLHQVLVGGDDHHLAALVADLAGVGGDEVVGLVAGQLHAGHAERLVASRTSPNCGIRSSGGGGRWALYWS